jgi:preprotein translocase subunit SecA
MNQQREVIYGLRNSVLDGEDVHGRIDEMLENLVDSKFSTFVPEDSKAAAWDLDGLRAEIEGLIFVPFEVGHPSTREEMRKRTLDQARAAYANREGLFGPAMREVERRVLLAVIDEKWRDHLHEIDIMKEGIYLRAYAQKDPLLEYKGEAFRAFDELMNSVETETVKLLFRVVPMPAPGMEGPAPAAQRSAQARHAEPVLAGGLPQRRAVPQAQEEVHATVSAYAGGEGQAAAVAPAKVRQVIRKDPKVGRNDPCPCGSGKKYKKCCGATE